MTKMVMMILVQFYAFDKHSQKQLLQVLIIFVHSISLMIFMKKNNKLYCKELVY